MIHKTSIIDLKLRIVYIFVFLVVSQLNLNGQEVGPKLIVIQDGDTISSYDSTRINAVSQSGFSMQFNSRDTLHYNEVLPLCDSIAKIQFICNKDTLYFFDRSVYLADKNNPLNKIYDFDYCYYSLSYKNMIVCIDNYPFEKTTLDKIAQDDLSIRNNTKRIIIVDFINREFTFEE